jgi:hypothetical protein
MPSPELDPVDLVPLCLGLGVQVVVNGVLLVAQPGHAQESERLAVQGLLGAGVASEEQGARKMG